MIPAVDASENRQTELRLGPKGRAVFSAAGWNKALRDAGIFAGNWWIANYGPLRWNRAYAMGQLGYRPTNKRHLLRVMSGQEAPFFETGAWQANFNSRSRTEAVAKKGGARFWIVCPVGHIIRPETAQQFKTIPPRESKAVAREYRRAIIMALQAQRVLVTKDPTARMSEKQKAKYLRRQRWRQISADAKAFDKSERKRARLKIKEQKKAERIAKRNARRRASIKPAA